MKFEKHLKPNRKWRTMTLTQDLKKEVKKVGFVAVGVSNLNMLRDLPYGKVKYVGVLKTPQVELPEVRSVILMGIHAWDTAFNLVVNSWNLRFNKKHKPRVPSESYQLYYQIMNNKAWKIAHYLMKRGYDSIPSVDIPLKTAAVKESGASCVRRRSYSRHVSRSCKRLLILLRTISSGYLTFAPSTSTTI
jgi:hypothetical protein